MERRQGIHIGSDLVGMPTLIEETKRLAEQRVTASLAGRPAI